MRQAQADLAREYGIYGFCCYSYWFNGRRLLSRPFDEVLASGQPDFHFCLCWANENWTRVWDGVIVDDYGASPACRKAVHDYRSANGITEEIRDIDWTGVFWQKGNSTSTKSPSASRTNPSRKAIEPRGLSVADESPNGSSALDNVITSSWAIIEPAKNL